MSLLYQNNFQSFAIGANPPYGALVSYSGAVSKIVADSIGLFGQTQSLQLTSTTRLAYPSSSSPGASFQQASVYQYIKIQAGIDEQGSILAFGNASSGGIVDFTLSGIRILADGTLGIVGDFSNTFAANTKVSDFSLLCEKWYLIRTDISFGTDLSNKLEVTCKVYVNGVVRASIPLTSTSISVASLPSTYWNYLKIGGSGLSINYGGLSIYDTIQADDFFPNPGTPSARVNQGVIELIKRRVLPASNTRIYEA
jgi:hypothetical protein